MAKTLTLHRTPNGIKSRTSKQWFQLNWREMMAVRLYMANAHSSMLPRDMHTCHWEFAGSGVYLLATYNVGSFA